MFFPLRGERFFSPHFFLDGSKKKRGTKKKSLWPFENDVVNVGAWSPNWFVPCPAVTAVTPTIL